jgi:predicted pore-forming effector associated with SMODS systems
MAGPTSKQIAERQELDVNLRRQLAARRYYSTAKAWRLAGQSVAIALALTSPIVLVLEPELGPKLAAIAGLWIFISRLLIVRIQRCLVIKGVAAQERFDCEVLGLRWNEALARQPGQEDIRRASQRTLKKIEDAKKWYPTPHEVAWPLSVLICQRSNTAWARRQHYYYGAFLYIGAGLWIVFGICFAAARSASLVEYLTIIALPSLPALLDWTDIAAAHLEAAKRRDSLEATIDEAIRNHDATDDSLREIQDRLFEHRSRSPLVPDWFYKLIRSAFEEDMRGAAADYADAGP